MESPASSAASEVPIPRMLRKPPQASLTHPETVSTIFPIHSNFSPKATIIAISPPATAITIPIGLVKNINIAAATLRSEEHTSELQSRGHLVCRLLLEKKKIIRRIYY